MSAVRVAWRLLLQPIELAVQDGALELPEAIVARDHVMLIPDPALDAAAVLDRSAAARPAPSSLVVMMPPSPAVRFLLDWKENEAMCPREPTGPAAIGRAVRMRGVLDQRRDRARRDAP